jgi:hypothetical protein
VEFILNKEFYDQLSKDTPDAEKLRKLAEEFKRWSFIPDEASLSLLAKQRLTRLIDEVLESPQDVNLLQTVEDLLVLLNKMGIKPDLWESQNIYFHLTQDHFPDMLEKAGHGNQMAQQWVGCFRRIGPYLGVKSP